MQPLVSLMSAVMPAEPPLGGGFEPLYVLALVQVAPDELSAGTMNVGPGNGVVSTGGIS